MHACRKHTVAAGIRVAPPQVFHSAKPVETRIDISRVRIVGTGQVDQRIAQIGLGAVLLDHNAQSQVIGQMSFPGVAIDQTGHQAALIVDRIGRAIVERHLAPVGIGEPGRPDRIRAAVGVGHLNARRRGKVDRTRVRLERLDHLPKAFALNDGLNTRRFLLIGWTLLQGASGTVAYTLTDCPRFGVHFSIDRLSKTIVQNQHFIDDIAAAGRCRVEARDPLDSSLFVVRRLDPPHGPIDARSDRDNSVLGPPSQQSRGERAKRFS
jgi:hypothetical protein